MFAAAARPGIAIFIATAPVNSVAFSRDGKTLATGNTNGTVQLWDVATQQAIGSSAEHATSVSSVAFSLDGKTLASGS
jgi:WD40 repeat protein